MPEGPSIVLLKEEVKDFTGQKVLAVEGNTKTIDIERLLNKKVIAFQSWGKHFLICFKDFTVRIHFLLFGSYMVNGRKSAPVRLSLRFAEGEVNFYSCSVKLLEGDVNTYYDWSGDVMNDTWDAKKAMQKLKGEPHELVCDALLDQDIFAGVGNIIKNEVLYRVKIHPESFVWKVPATKLKKMVTEARNYSFEFLEWKRNFELKRHWLAHTKTLCLRCDGPITRKITGKRKRRSFFCVNCQNLYRQ